MKAPGVRVVVCCLAALMAIAIATWMFEAPTQIYSPRDIAFTGRGAASAFRGLGTEGVAPPYFTPPPHIAQRARALVTPIIRERLRKDGEPPWVAVPKAETYRIQYFGGHRSLKPVVLINAFCQTHGTSWLTRIVEYYDGGACYGHFIYDVERDRVVGFQFNSYG